MKLFIAVHPFSLAVVQKSKTLGDISLAIGTQIYSDFFSQLDSSKSKANMISLATFFIAGLSFIMYNYKIQAQQNKILFPVPHSDVFLLLSNVF